MPPHRTSRSIPDLPAHLSYRSALVLLPEVTSNPWVQPLQSLRRVHDKNYHRWPPHINLLYPFLARPSNSLPSLTSRIRRAFTNSPPFTARFARTGTFIHSARSATVYLEPGGEDDDDEVGERQGIIALQRRLQAEFRECNADPRPFVPHLSVGGAAGEAGAEELKKEVERVMRGFCKEQWAEESGELVGEVDEGKSGDGEVDGGWDLVWKVDRVVVIERTGYREPFRVVEEILLGGDDPEMGG